MRYQPRVAHYTDWDIVLKCKSGKYASKDECLKAFGLKNTQIPLNDTT